MVYIVAILFSIIIIEGFWPKDKSISSFIDAPTNLFWFVMNWFLLPYIITEISFYIGHLWNFEIPSIFSILSLDKKWNLGLQILIGFIFIDFFKYALHFLFHRIEFFWSFHKVHHSIERLTALSSFRMSWFEVFINIGASSLLVSFLGFELSTIFILNIVSSVVCIIQHANIKTPLLEKFEWLFVTPENHRVHHAKKLLHTHGQNFGFILNIWDKVFGTYVKPQSLNQYEVGLPHEDFPKHFWKQFFYPVKISSLSFHPGKKIDQGR